MFWCIKEVLVILIVNASVTGGKNTTISPYYCNYVDVVFVVDGSGSIFGETFETIRQWLTLMTSSIYDKLDSKVQIGILQYSGRNEFEIPFRLGDCLSKNCMEKKIINMTQIRHGTYTYSALKRIVEVEYPHSPRANFSSKSLVLITDGHSNDGTYLLDWYHESVERNVTSYAIGIGQYNLTELKIIANGGVSEKNVFTNENIFLSDISLSLVEDFCEENFTAKDICRESKVRSKHTDFYIFKQAIVNTLVPSKETCANPDVKYTASIRCVEKKNLDGSVYAYFDKTTLMEVLCNISSYDLLIEVKTKRANTSSVERCIASANAISQKFSSQRGHVKEDVTNVVKVVNVLGIKIKKLEIEVTDTTMYYLIWTTDNIIIAAMNSNTTNLTERDKVLFAESLEFFPSNVIMMRDKLTISGQRTGFEARMLESELPSANPIVFFGRIHNSTVDLRSDGAQLVKSIIPASAVPVTAIKNSSKAIFYFHKNGILFPKPHNPTIHVGQIVSTQISSTKLKDLSDPIKHSFPHTDKDRKDENACSQTIPLERCAYLSIPNSKWKFDGCITDIDQSNNLTICSCNHTTNFAILVQTYCVKRNFALDVIGKIGCISSIIGLSLLLTIYISSRTLRTNDLNQIHIHLSVCLLLAYITFIGGVERSNDNYIACAAVGFILQLSLLCAWGWMLVEFITIYRKLVTVVMSIGEKYVLKCAILVYSISTSISGVTIIVAHTTISEDSVQNLNWKIRHNTESEDYSHVRSLDSHYISDRLCWLHSYSLYFGFLVPAGIVLCINVLGFFLLLRKICRHPPDLGQRSVNLQLKDHVFRVATLSAVLGLTWAFAIPLTTTDNQHVNLVFDWLFSLFNAFQGTFIFFIFCVWRKEVRDVWLRGIGNRIRSSLSHNKVKSGGRSPFQTGTTTM
ncbi:adhesion G-protein coupled receptor G6-like isoform X2 [Styela clava]